MHKSLLLRAALFLFAGTFGAPSCGSGDLQQVVVWQEDWLRGDLHMHTTWSDGWDDTATLIRLAESLDSKVLLAEHPEYEGNGLDFIAITDHRTVDVLSDPAWTSERLILIGGEEWGSSGHAGALGITEFVDHDPDEDGVTLEDVSGGAQATHAQGGLFSINHPFLSNNPFPWDLRINDAIEVWNSGWALMSPSYTTELLDEWEAAHGLANPLFRRAVQEQRRGASFQALTYYEAMLARGVHVALVGGSDRHTLLLPGFPTTWVRAATPNVAGVIQGIRDRHTFVSRTPVATQILLLVQTPDGGLYEMGDEIPVPAGGVEVKVSLHVGRGDRGLLRLVGGEAATSDAALTQAPLGSIVLEEDVIGNNFKVELTLDVQPGGWLYPMVFDELVQPELTAEQAEQVRELAVNAVATADEDFTGLATMALDVIDLDIFFDASLCEPKDWEPNQMQCMPQDLDGSGSFFVPDWIDRPLNVVVEDDLITDWCMGAVGSAVRFVAE
ncbi:MAG TPA: CehA/McbA family metallohydrolase [Myxococcota bacterium]|nr:CehA/McbA family metallohydrolase [Myxococcota bacterium]